MGILTLFIIYVGIIILSYLVGRLFCWKDGSKTFLENCFFQIFLGSIVLVFSYALIKSRFTSFYIVGIGLIIIYLLNKNSTKQLKKNISEKLKIQDLLIPVFLSLISFLFWTIFTIEYSDLSVHAAFYDYLFYSEISRGLSLSGIESPFNRFYPIYIADGSLPYHYFDLWFNALVSEVFKLNTFNCLMAVVYPFFYFLTLLGISTFLISRIKGIFHLVAASFLLTLIISIEFSFYSSLELFDYSWAFHPSNYRQLKILHTYPFILFILHLFQDNKIYKAILYLLLLATIYNTLLVSILPSVLVLSVYLFFKNKNTKELVLVMSYISLGILYNFFFTTKTDAVYNTDIEIVHYKTMIIVFFEYVLKCFSIYFPVFIALAMLFYQYGFRKILRNTEFFIFIFISLTSAIIFSSFFHGRENYNQALYNFIPSIALMMLLFVFVRINFKPIHYFIYSLFLLLNLYFISKYKDFGEKYYTESYIEKCRKELLSNENFRFLIYNPNSIRWDYNFDELGQFTSFLPLKSNGFNIANDFGNSEFSNLSPFGKWCNSSGLCINSNALKKYMKLNNIEYLFSTTNYSLPFEYDLSLRIVAVDLRSGEMMYKMN